MVNTTVAPNVISFLKLVITNLGLNPSQYTFHMFPRSGASMAFDNNVQFENIKQHGNWQSEAAIAVPTTFQQLLSKPI